MIYIAAPYSDDDKAVVEYRVKKVCEYSAKLLTEGISCISPITTGTGILTQVKLPTDFAFWSKLSYDLLDVCTELHILMLPGWEKSIGVDGEVHHAAARQMKITYIKID